MKRYIGLFLFTLITALSFAQTFKGSVADAAGNPVPYAAIYLKELKSGFTTDEHGRFQTLLPAGQYTCNVSSLGFVSQSFSFRMPAHDYEKDIILAERIYSLPQVSVVKGSEDPAYAVMRQAIARAPYYRTQIKGFTAGTYLKGTGKGTSIPAILKLSKEVRKESKELLGKLFLLEEQQQVTFTAPNIWSKRVIAYKNSFPDIVEVDMGLTTVNFYTPEVFGKISPLNKRAFSFYRFRLDGYYMEDGHMINKIRVIPRREDARLLEGDLFIVEDLWCASAAEFNVRASGMKAKIKVICKEVQPAVFLPVSTTMTTTIDIMGFKAEASYLAAVHYTDVKTDIEPEVKTDKVVKAVKSDTMPAKKHKYERPARMVRANAEIDTLADKRDSLYWATVRSVPLRREEMQSYQYKEEKIQQKLSSGNDTTRKQTVAGEVMQALLAGKTFTTASKKAWLTIPNLVGYVPEYNFVDGFWVGARLKMGIELSPSASLRFLPSFYYTTARKEWVGQGELTLDYAPRRMGCLSLSGGRTSADYNGENGEYRLINAFSSALFGHNHIKFYENTFLTADHAIEPLNGMLFTASLSWQRRKMLDNHIRRSWFKREAEPNMPENKDFRPMPDNDLLKASFGLEYTPAHYYHMSKGRKVYENSRYPTFGLKYDRAFPMHGSRYLASYHLMQFSARQEIEFGMFNRLLWSVNAGSFWDARHMQFPDFKHFAATDIWVTARPFDSGFNLLNNYALSTSTRWAQAHLSWYTPYLLLKQLPFLSDKLFDEALHLRSIVLYGQQPYTELGYSAGFSGMARIGVFVGFDSLKFRSVGVAVSLPLLL